MFDPSCMLICSVCKRSFPAEHGVTDRHCSEACFHPPSHFEDDDRDPGGFDFLKGPHEAQVGHCIYVRPGCDPSVLPMQFRESARRILFTLGYVTGHNGCCCNGNHIHLDGYMVQKLTAAGYFVVLEDRDDDYKGYLADRYDSYEYDGDSDYGDDYGDDFDDYGCFADRYDPHEYDPYEYDDLMGDRHEDPWRDYSDDDGDEWYFSGGGGLREVELEALGEMGFSLPSDVPEGDVPNAVVPDPPVERSPPRKVFFVGVFEVREDGGWWVRHRYEGLVPSQYGIGYSPQERFRYMEDAVSHAKQVMDSMGCPVKS